MLHNVNNKRSLDHNNYELQRDRLNNLVNGGGEASSSREKLPSESLNDAPDAIYCERQNNTAGQEPVRRRRFRAFNALPSRHRTVALVRKNVTQTCRNVGYVQLSACAFA